ncbi:metallophosphoesterase family protein [Thermogemmatispora tikiterensis]|uniref:Metallophosphoesterase n=1 Tax=Thermogemmatispora tikiterensis TaxID=1825093 RepID=A0A328VJB7_9CHLR|nr:metallophosphoesterase [Thermogemmatispora tikiterensis]RAQ94355.1 metallophosphoesterase [Thermogemmatispora tikiterensis]
MFGTRRTTIFFATDIHGSERCFMKFINSAKFYGANVLILGGDITGKALIPIVRDGHSSRYRATFLGERVTLESEEALAAFERQVRHAGAYPFRTTVEELAALESDRTLVDRLFTRLMVESVQRWCELAEERLRGSGVRCFIDAGNDDEPEIVEVLKQASYVEMPEGQVVLIDDEHEMVSAGFANLTPWHAPRDIPDEELGRFIESMAGQLQHPERAIFNVHVPPYGSGLDTAPQLDEQLKPVVVGGEIATGPVGSKAVRAMIERFQPLVSLHGHVHESRAVSKIGRTTCINPGSEYGDGHLRAALVTLKGPKLLSYQLITG